MSLPTPQDPSEKKIWDDDYGRTALFYNVGLYSQEAVITCSLGYRLENFSGIFATTSAVFHQYGTLIHIHEVQEFSFHGIFLRRHLYEAKTKFDASLFIV